MSPVFRGEVIVTVVLPNAASLGARYPGHSTRMCFIVSLVSSPQFSHVGGAALVIRNPWVRGLCPNRSLASVLSQRRFLQTVFGRGDRLSVISRSLFGRKRGAFHRCFHVSLVVLFILALSSPLVKRFIDCILSSVPALARRSACSLPPKPTWLGIQHK